MEGGKMKILFKSSTTWVGTETGEEIEVEDDISDAELDAMAYEIAMETHQIESWWERI